MKNLMGKTICLSENTDLDSFARYSLDNEEMAKTNGGWCFVLICTGFLGGTIPIIVDRPSYPPLEA